MCKNEPVAWRIAATSGLCLSLFLGVFMASFFLQSAHASSRDIIQAFTERFTQTSGEEFYEIWHSDCHRRCRSQLIGHVTLACTFDPYKLTKRSLTKRDVNNTIAHIIKDTEDTTPSPFLARTAAAAFLNSATRGKSSPAHRRRKRGIMNECCYSKSCSWEEYAEFCHTYNRRPAVRNTQCFP